MQMITPAFILPDIDHAPANQAVAENADAVVVERIPFAVQVGLLEGGQFFIQWNVSVHSAMQH